MAYREEHDIGRLAWVGPQSESAFLVTSKAVCYHAVGGRFQYKGRVGGIRAVLPTSQVGQAAAKPGLAYGNSLGPCLAQPINLVRLEPGLYSLGRPAWPRPAYS